MAGPYKANATPAAAPHRPNNRTPGPRQQRAGTGAEERLYQTDGHHGVAEDPVEDSEEVRIERRLIEDAVAEPIAVRDTAAQAW